MASGICPPCAVRSHALADAKVSCSRAPFPVPVLGGTAVVESPSAVKMGPVAHAVPAFTQARGPSSPA
eukprot:1464154-Alexandrium_andersonii.AAC.1